MNKVETGLDLIGKYSEIFKNKRLGLISNHTGFDRSFVSAHECLLNNDYNLTALFAPEHGYFGNVQDALLIHHDSLKTNYLPIYSLYNETRYPTETMLSKIDLLIFDIQDIGSRFYTFTTTMENAMLACAKNKKQFVVLDRPNPINGIDFEGAYIDPSFESFVGSRLLPIRHGLTTGELALYLNKEKNINCELHIIPLKGWDRSCYMDETDLQFIGTSPNLPSLKTAITYNSICFHEGTSLSEGRGTTTPFEQIGAPFIDGKEFAKELNSLSLPGIHFYPIYFTPIAFKYLYKLCEGVKLLVTDRKLFKPVLTGLKILETLNRMYPKNIEWVEYPEIPGQPYIDFLIGTDLLRKGKLSFDELLLKGEVDERDFKDRRKEYLLY